MTLGWEMDCGSVERGAGSVPSVDPLDQDNHRLRFEWGWRPGTHFEVVLGFRWDGDGDPAFDRSPFDGGHGRVVVRW